MIVPKRNDPCWCGSGKKYKHCHLNREKQQPPAMWEVEKGLRTEFNKKICSVPEKFRDECDGKIIKAHSVSTSWLKKITPQNHVYGFKPSIYSIGSNSGILKPELIGINNASTFTGFCKYHDKKVFSELENKPFIGNPKQCFLLAYRAIAREFFTKFTTNNAIQMVKALDKGTNLKNQIDLQNFTLNFEQGNILGLNDIKSHKSEYDSIFESENFEDLKYFIIEVSDIPTILCSGAVFISYDFNGKKLQNLRDSSIRPDTLCYSVIPSQHSGFIVFVWLSSSHKSCIKFIHSLQDIKNQFISSSIVRFLFEFCENIYISPNWWDNLNENYKTKLTNRFNKAINPFIERGNNCLIDDNGSIINVDWKVKNIRTNI